jgi:hypothetical protein
MTRLFSSGIALALAVVAAACSSQSNPAAPTQAAEATSTALHTPIACDHDTQAPTIGAVSASPNSLWPPNHKWRTVAVSYVLSDNCSSVTSSLSVMSDEPVNGLGDGDTAPDWEVVNARTVRLRAERSGTGDGRVYTITIRAVDRAGNAATAVVRVTVPHDQGKK